MTKLARKLRLFDFFALAFGVMVANQSASLQDVVHAVIRLA